MSHSPQRAPDPGAAFLVTHYLGASVFWASGFLFIKLAPDLSPLALSALRGAVAVLALGLWFCWQREPLAPTAGALGHWAVIGSINGWIPNVLTTFALATIPAGQGAMIQASTPLIVAGVAPLMFADERLTPRRAAGVAVGFGGMALLVGPAAFGEGGSIAGFAAMTGAAACYAAGGLYIRSIRLASPAQLAFGQQLFSALPALGLALALEGRPAFAPVANNLPALLALGVVATAVPNVFYMRLIRSAGAMRSAMVSYLIPVWATLMGVLFLRESVGLREIAAGLVILAGVWLVSAPR